MRKCTKEELQRIIGDRNWYQGAMCVNDRKKVNIRANWFRKNHDVPFISLVECDRKKRKCKSKEEIE